MGCDIHCYVEQWDGKKWLSVYPPRDPSLNWDDWGRYAQIPGPIERLSQAHSPEVDLEPKMAPPWNFGRHYDAFGNLAGVRRQDIVFEEPKGFPEDASDAIKRLYWLRIVETETEEDMGTIIRSRAEQWVNRENGERYCELNGESYVTHPDWHSASHYTFGELSGYLDEAPDAESRVFELCDKLAEVFTDNNLENRNHVRVVFWFDN